MSPNINSFVGDLVEMAKAFEELPGVRRELDAANSHVEAYAKQVQDREISILDLKSQLEAANDRIRKVEAERDSAETMFLEADERTSKALRFLGQVQGMAVQAEVALSPPKPQPEPTPIPAFIEPRAEQGQGEASPTGEPQAGSLESQPPIEDHGMAHNLNLGQSDPLPTAEASTAETEAALTPSSATSETASETANPSPYSGKRYWYQVNRISLSDWLSGGGTEEDYNWRPEARPSYPA